MCGRCCGTYLLPPKALGMQLSQTPVVTPTRLLGDNFVVGAP
jgi:hypothetical protein